MNDPILSDSKLSPCQKMHYPEARISTSSNLKPHSFHEFVQIIYIHFAYKPPLYNPKLGGSASSTNVPLRPIQGENRKAAFYCIAGHQGCSLSPTNECQVQELVNDLSISSKQIKNYSHPWHYNYTWTM